MGKLLHRPHISFLPSVSLHFPFRNVLFLALVSAAHSFSSSPKFTLRLLCGSWNTIFLLIPLHSTSCFVSSCDLITLQSSFSPGLVIFFQHFKLCPLSFILVLWTTVHFPEDWKKPLYTLSSSAKFCYESVTRETISLFGSKAKRIRMHRTRNNQE